MERQLYYILAEYNLLRTHHPAGIFVTPIPGNPLKWLGVISVRSGYYVGGIFHVCVILPDDFPSQEIPRVFLPKTFFHPFVNPDTGELSLISAFSHWNPDGNRLWHLFQHIRCLLTSPTGCIRQYSAEQIQQLTRPSTGFHEPPISGPCLTYPNPEAADLIVNHKDRFEARARDCVKQLSVWASHSHPLTSTHMSDTLDITGWDDESFLKRARLALQSHSETKDPPVVPMPVRGYSWIDTNTLNIFSARSPESDQGET